MIRPEQWLEQIGLNTIQSSLLVKLFLLVFLILLTNYIIRRLFNRLAIHLQTTVNEWDNVLLEAARKPVLWTIWTLGIVWAIQLIDHSFDQITFEFTYTLRHMSIITLIAWFTLRLVHLLEVQLVQPCGKRDAWDHTTVTAVGKLLKASVVITTIIISMQAFGLSVSGVLAFGGVGGIAVGFAAKDLLSNFFGGLMIYMDRQFVVGEWIRSPDKDIEGIVEHIGWRITRIRTFDMRPLYVPNATFASIAVENPSRMSNRRIYENFGVRYEDSDRIEGIIDETRRMLLQHPDIDNSKTLMVNLNNFAPHSVEFFVYTFTRTTHWEQYHDIKQDILHRIMTIVADHGASFAYPTQTLHLNTPVMVPEPPNQHT